MLWTLATPLLILILSLTPIVPSLEPQKQTSSAEIGSATEPLVAMHMRSEAADAWHTEMSVDD